MAFVLPWIKDLCHSVLRIRNDISGSGSSFEFFEFWIQIRIRICYLLYGFEDPYQNVMNPKHCFTFALISGVGLCYTGLDLSWVSVGIILVSGLIYYYVRRIYEIVRLHYTSLSDTPAYKSYRWSYSSHRSVQVSHFFKEKSAIFGRKIHHFLKSAIYKI